MPPTRLTRAETKARTRADLLRAALRLFLRQGYGATTVDQVAEEAGVTSGAVYSNFATKEDLFLALLDEAADPARGWITEDRTAPIDVVAARGDTPRARADTWGRALRSLRPDRRSVALVMELTATALRSPRSRRRLARHDAARFEALGSRLVETLAGRPEDALALAVMAQSIYGGLTSYEAIAGTRLDEEVWARAYRSLAAFAADA